MLPSWHEVPEFVPKKPTYRKSKFVLILLLISFLYLIFLAITHFNYVDITKLCFIHVNSTGAHRRSILSALQSLKDINFADYSMVCRYVDNVVADYCLSSEKTRPNINRLPTDGCYIKGTHTIFLSPSLFTKGSTADHRTAVLRYAQASRNFWESNKQ